MSKPNFKANQKVVTVRNTHSFTGFLIPKGSVGVTTGDPYRDTDRIGVFLDRKSLGVDASGYRSIKLEDLAPAEPEGPFKVGLWARHNRSRRAYHIDDVRGYEPSLHFEGHGAWFQSGFFTPIGRGPVVELPEIGTAVTVRHRARSLMGLQTPDPSQVRTVEQLDRDEDYSVMLNDVGPDSGRWYRPQDLLPSPTLPPVRDSGGPFDERDTVRLIGPNFGAYAEVGMIEDRLYTVREGTSIVNGLISLAGVRGSFPAKKFQLVTKAAPLPEPVRPAPGTSGWATTEHGRLHGLIDSDGDFVYHFWNEEIPDVDDSFMAFGGLDFEADS